MYLPNPNDMKPEALLAHDLELLKYMSCHHKVLRTSPMTRFVFTLTQMYFLVHQYKKQRYIIHFGTAYIDKATRLAKVIEILRDLMPDFEKHYLCKLPNNENIPFLDWQLETTRRRLETIVHHLCYISLWLLEFYSVSKTETKLIKKMNVPCSSRQYRIWSAKIQNLLGHFEETLSLTRNSWRYILPTTDANMATGYNALQCIRFSAQVHAPQFQPVAFILGEEHAIWMHQGKYTILTLNAVLQTKF